LEGGVFPLLFFDRSRRNALQKPKRRKNAAPQNDPIIEVHAMLKKAMPERTSR
jgi:hypothetical protein